MVAFLPFPLIPLFWIALLVGAWFLFRRRDDRGRTQSADESSASDTRGGRSRSRSTGSGARSSGAGAKPSNHVGRQYRC